MCKETPHFVAFPRQQRYDKGGNAKGRFTKSIGASAFIKNKVGTRLQVIPVYVINNGTGALGLIERHCASWIVGQIAT